MTITEEQALTIAFLCAALIGGRNVGRIDVSYYRTMARDVLEPQPEKSGG